MRYNSDMFADNNVNQVPGGVLFNPALDAIVSNTTDAARLRVVSATVIRLLVSLNISREGHVLLIQEPNEDRRTFVLSEVEQKGPDFKILRDLYVIHIFPKMVHEPTVSEPDRLERVLGFSVFEVVDGDEGDRQFLNKMGSFMPKALSGGSSVRNFRDAWQCVINGMLLEAFETETDKTLEQLEGHLPQQEETENGN